MKEQHNEEEQKITKAVQKDDAVAESAPPWTVETNIQDNLNNGNFEIEFRQSIQLYVLLILVVTNV